MLLGVFHTITTYHAEAHLTSILEELELADSNFDPTWDDDDAAAEANGILVIQTQLLQREIMSDAACTLTLWTHISPAFANVALNPSVSFLLGEYLVAKNVVANTRTGGRTKRQTQPNTPRCECRTIMMRSGNALVQ